MHRDRWTTGQPLRKRRTRPRPTTPEANRPSEKGSGTELAVKVALSGAKSEICPLPAGTTSASRGHRLKPYCKGVKPVDGNAERGMSIARLEPEMVKLLPDPALAAPPRT